MGACALYIRRTYKNEKNTFPLPCPCDTSRYTGRYAVRAIQETMGACTTAQGLHRVGLDAEGVESFVKAHTEGL